MRPEFPQGKNDKDKDDSMREEINGGSFDGTSSGHDNGAPSNQITSVKNSENSKGNSSRDSIEGTVFYNT